MNTQPNKKLIMAVVLVIVVISAIILVIFLTVGKSKNENTNQPTVTNQNTNNNNTNNNVNINSNVNAKTNTNTNTNQASTQEDSKTIIANIESVIKTELAGNNNQGSPYFQWILVDQRMTADEEYLAVIRYNADYYGVAGDYQSKMQQEKNEIIQKAAAVLKKIMALGYPMGIIQFEGYNSTGNPAYGIEIEKAQIYSVDWNQSVETLAKILPTVWTVKYNSYSLLDVNK